MYNSKLRYQFLVTSIIVCFIGCSPSSKSSSSPPKPSTSSQPIPMKSGRDSLEQATATRYFFDALNQQPGSPRSPAESSPQTAVWKFECNPYPHNFTNEALSSDGRSNDGFGARTRKGRCYTEANKLGMNFVVHPFDFRGDHPSDRSGNGGSEIAMVVPTVRPEYTKNGKTTFYSYWLKIDPSTKNAFESGMIALSDENMASMTIGQFHTQQDASCTPDVQPSFDGRNAPLATHTDFGEGFSPGPGVFLQYKLENNQSKYSLKLSTKQPNHPFYTSDGNRCPDGVCIIALSEYPFTDAMFGKWINITLEINWQPYKVPAHAKCDFGSSAYSHAACQPSQGYIRWYVNFEPVKNHNEGFSQIYEANTSKFNGLTTQLNECQLFTKLGIYMLRSNAAKGKPLPNDNGNPAFKDIFNAFAAKFSGSTSIKDAKNSMKQMVTYANFAIGDSLSSVKTNEPD